MLQQDFRPREAIELARRRGRHLVHVGHAVSSDMLNVLDAEDGLAFDTLRLFCCGGARLPRPSSSARPRYGCCSANLRLHEAARTCSCPGEVRRRVERRLVERPPFAGIEVKVIDEMGAARCPGRPGRDLAGAAHVRGVPERATAPIAPWTMRGWFYSGDLCYMDGEGHIRINSARRGHHPRRQASRREIDDDLIGAPGLVALGHHRHADARLGERIPHLRRTERPRRASHRTISSPT